MSTNYYFITQKRKENKEKQSNLEDYLKNIVSTFDLIFDELRLITDNDMVKFEHKGDLDCGLIKTFNFSLEKLINSDNTKYIFVHGNNIISLDKKFPLHGSIFKNGELFHLTDIFEENKIIDYLNLVKTYLDYYVLDRNQSTILKNGELVIDNISKEDFKNREKSGYSYFINKTI